MLLPLSLEAACPVPRTPPMLLSLVLPHLPLWCPLSPGGKPLTPPNPLALPPATRHHHDEDTATDHTPHSPLPNICIICASWPQAAPTPPGAGAPPRGESIPNVGDSSALGVLGLGGTADLIEASNGMGRLTSLK